MVANQYWDNKFRLIDKPHHKFDDLEDNYSQRMKEQEAAKAVIDGVGRDAEIVTNSRGGKQSKTTMALHLIDPMFLRTLIGTYNVTTLSKNYNLAKAINRISIFMENDNQDYLLDAMACIEGDILQRLIRIAKVLQYGADRYEANNWRLIPQESHINHALIHLVAHLMGDKQDDHLDHALCRLMMAYATEKSEGFDYNKYVPTIGTIVETASSHPDFRPIQKLQEEYDKFICKYKYDCHYKEDSK